MIKPAALSAKKILNSSSLKASAAVVWLLFSVALACWWLIFGLNQIDRISQLEGTAPAGVAAELARRHRMLLSEGATLIALLMGGGVALLYHVRAEARRAQGLREFFAAFTHDLKTSLASLRLQAESLEEDLRSSGPEHQKLMRRLVKDTVRLELQLENSLLLASPEDSSRFYLESIRLGELVKSMAHQWPELRIAIEGDAWVRADHRALESIFKNLLQNSLVHGRASGVEVKIESRSEQKVAHAIAPSSNQELQMISVRVLDNGRGFKGDRARLARIFERHASTSGSGLGLYLAANLTRRLGGALSFVSEKDLGEGFGVELTLPESSAQSSADSSADSLDERAGRG